MRELSLNVLDIAQNSISANASLIEIEVSESTVNKELLIGIYDNGKGMTKDQLIHITEPFYRTDKSRSRAEGGAGLGLALCRQIVQTHGAVMEFESEYGKGTLVTVTFTSRK